MYAQLSVTKKQLAGYKAMEDFAVMAQNAYQTFQSNGGACPAGTTQIPTAPTPKPFCWPDSTINNPDCIYHPLNGPDSANPRLICISAGTMEVVSKYEVPFWKKMLSGFAITAEAQNMDEHIPNLTGAPTISYAATPNCASAYNPTYCKRCETVGVETANLNCVYLRVCLGNGACNPANNDQWTLQRIGVQSFM